jgi:CheY-like chemotaxis protein
MTDNIKILVVDDELISRKVVADTLSGAGYQVVSCDSGKQALEVLRQQPDFDLIVLDHLMPEMNGVEFLHAMIAENLPCVGLPVLMLTAVRDHDEILSALEAGVQEYLTKPVDPEHLLELARSMTA